MTVSELRAKATTAACDQCAANKQCLLRGLYAPQKEIGQRSAVHSENLRRGDALFTTGQMFKRLFVVRSGSIKTSVIGSDGESQITGFHLQGAMLGLDGIDNGEHIHCAEALENSNVCSISFARFSARITRSPQLLHNLLRRISHDIKLGQKMTFVLGKCNAQQRMALFLLDLSGRCQRSGMTGENLTLTMLRSDIASYLGLASETACRVLQRFQSMGLITVERRRITLNNMVQLRNIAGNRLLQQKSIGIAS